MNFYEHAFTNIRLLSLFVVQSHVPYTVARLPAHCSLVLGVFLHLNKIFFAVFVPLQGVFTDNAFSCR